VRIEKPSSPKRRAKPDDGRAGWYSYYAGYPSTFVQDVLGGLALNSESTLLDPWVGSGTTTQTASELGFVAHGYDINPVMVLVSKARLLTSDVSPSEISLCRQIVDQANEFAIVYDDDPLAIWLSVETIGALRGLERATFSLLVQPDLKDKGSFDPRLDGVSSLAAFFYVALFRTLRDLLNRFKSSNPTWLKRHVEESQVVRTSALHVSTLFWKHVTNMAASQFQLLPPNHPPETLHQCQIRVGSSQHLPNESESIDLVLGSPPYCTRIDYAMATYPELALLHSSDAAIESLRRQMLGTATVEKNSMEASVEWGNKVRMLLERVYDHPSKAARSYYYKNMIQYFNGLFLSLKEIDRVLRKGGQSVIVVQDSRFKDIHVDLPEIVTDVCRQLGWQREHKFNYPSSRHLGRINQRSRSETRSAVESVLYFKCGK
jgi:DNA modification methylase